jgi:hypothetical protein
MTGTVRVSDIPKLLITIVIALIQLIGLGCAAQSLRLQVHIEAVLIVFSAMGIGICSCWLGNNIHKFLQGKKDPYVLKVGNGPASAELSSDL